MPKEEELFPPRRDQVIHHQSTPITKPSTHDHINYHNLDTPQQQQLHPNSHHLIQNNIQTRHNSDQLHPDINLHERCLLEIEAKQSQIKALQEMIQVERAEVELDKKANEVYIENYHRLDAVCQKYLQIDRQDSLDDLIDQLETHLQASLKQRKQLQKAHEEQIENNHHLQAEIQNIQQASHIQSPHNQQPNYQEDLPIQANQIKIQQLSQIIDEQSIKIRELRGDLLKSSQNNINAIFNTEITEANCLHFQIKKLNSDIEKLQNNLIEVKLQSTIEMQRFITSVSKEHQKGESKKIIKIYPNGTNMEMIQIQSDEDAKKQLLKLSKKTQKDQTMKEKENQKNLISRNKKSITESLSISVSGSGQRRSKRMRSAENGMSELIEGYKYLQEEYKGLERTIEKLNNNQSEFKSIFVEIKKEISNSIKHQIQEMQSHFNKHQTKQKSEETSKQNQEQLLIAKTIQGKLNHLINTMNKPQQVIPEKYFEEDPYSAEYRTVDVQYVRKNNDLNNKNRLLEKQLQEIKLEKLKLEKQLSQKEKMFHNKNILQIQSQEKINEKHVSLIEKLYEEQHQKEIKNTKSEEYNMLSIQEQLESSKKSDKEQVIQEIQAFENKSDLVMDNGFNSATTFHKNHSSHSYHQKSGSKQSEVEVLNMKLRQMEGAVKEKQLRINQLENTIIDHIQSRTNLDPITQSNELLKEKYETYISNLKTLLNEAKKQNTYLKNQFIKTTQTQLHRLNDHAEVNSASQSDRTTKNYSQNRRVQGTQRNYNNFQQIKLRLAVEESLERCISNLFEFKERLSFGDQNSNQFIVIKAVDECLKVLVDEAKRNQPTLYETMMNSSQISRKIYMLMGNV